ncbi:hypothetical protein [Streptomyces sp. NPDC093514]|uniref:hypothetical protein n=1 Tax=Streptomyces sp. NPDC093514 TaxID=3366039 RepID=UPI003821B118
MFEGFDDLVALRGGRGDFEHQLPDRVAAVGEVVDDAAQRSAWVSKTKTRRDKLTADQLAALAQLGVDWAG